MIHNDLHDAWIGYVHQKKQLIRKSSKSRRFRSGSEIYLSVFDQRSIGASCWTKLWLKYVCRIRYANINAIIYGHNITIIYRRTSMVVYVQNMTCAPIHNKMIFDWKHQGGQGGAKHNQRTLLWTWHCANLSTGTNENLWTWHRADMWFCGNSCCLGSILV